LLRPSHKSHQVNVSAYICLSFSLWCSRKSSFGFSFTTNNNNNKQQQQSSIVCKGKTEGERKMTAAAAAAATTTGLNLGGKLFFGGLCVGTFGLGCWQTRRYFDKQRLVQQREDELKMDPLPLEGTTTTTAAQLQRRIVQGHFQHEKQLLVGPRGPPPGAISESGPSSGRSSGGMSSSPQVCMHVCMYGERTRDGR
jgi:hypothetical protein